MWSERNKKAFFLLWLLTFTTVLPDNGYTEQEQQEQDIGQSEYIIGAICVVNNKNVTSEAILNSIPYAVGQIFDPQKTGLLIRNLYALGYFNNIQVYAKNIDERSIELIIFVKEDLPISSISYSGNSHLKPHEIEKKLKISELCTANMYKINEYAYQIKKMYIEKDYHDAVVTAKQSEQDGTVDLLFEITENKSSRVKRVFFEGNSSVSSKILRSLGIFTREDWILGSIDKAGSFQPEALDFDKHVIEEFYQSSGFLTAQVIDIKVERDVVTQDFLVTYVIDEGNLFTIDKVSVPGNDLISEPTLIARIGIYPGQFYSRSRIKQALETLRLIWGEFGYINAEILPDIEPNLEHNTVSIALRTELGNKMFLNRVVIKGNKKTKDHVIRRQLTLVEGDILTTSGIERSKNRVASLGYFDPRDGVVLKTVPISDELVDAQVLVKEINTGKIYTQLGFGASLKDLTSPAKALKLGVTAADPNVLGTGIAANISASVAADELSFVLNITDPWLFNRPILGAFDTYYKQSEYEDIHLLVHVPIETLVGSAVNFGFLWAQFGGINAFTQTGFESITFKNNIEVETKAFEQDVKAAENYGLLMKRRFQEGLLLWVSQTLNQDLRNNPVHPNQGYQWSISQKIGIPANFLGKTFGFYKFEADATYYTPLIGDYNLIFMIHGHLGLVSPIGDNNVPYRELFHIGGTATVRGFTFGQIGPTFGRDSIGARKAFFINSELIFPIMHDLSIKGAFFYDGGAGWDTLHSEFIDKDFLRNNRFNYRHAVGIGIRVLRPTPVRIDWGFKLDRRKGEKEFEVSLTMLREF